MNPMVYDNVYKSFALILAYPESVLPSACVIVWKRKYKHFRVSFQCSDTQASTIFTTISRNLPHNLSALISFVNMITILAQNISVTHRTL